MKVIEQTETDARTVALLRAIAHPARFRIVKLLAARQACVCVGAALDSQRDVLSAIARNGTVLRRGLTLPANE